MSKLFLKLILLFTIFCSFPMSGIAKEKYNTEIRYLYVQPGQTLHNIVRRLYPRQRKEWPKLRAEIVQINPHAFIHADPTKMKAGVKLRLPEHRLIRRTRGMTEQHKQVGIVTEVRGQVVAVNARKVSRRLKKNNPVFLGDKLITGQDGFIQLHMIDKAVLDLHCYSIMVIENYALKTGSRSSILNLLQGSLRKVSGTIGKLKNDIYELKTPVANVGVRGTEYALRVFQSRGCGGRADADDGLYLQVIRGLVDVHNRAGSALVGKGETAYVALPDKAPVKEKINKAILNLVPEKLIKKTEVNVVKSEPNSNLWWWMLGAVLLAVVL